MTASQYRIEFDQVLTCYRTGDHGEAYRITNQLLDSFPLSIELLLLRARAIQLLTEADLTIYPSATLELAQESLHTAVLVAPRNAEVLNEFGYFVLSVRDRASEAVEQFKAAERVAAADLLAALVGQMKCFQELGDAEALERVKTKIKASFSDELLLGLVDLDW